MTDQAFFFPNQLKMRDVLANPLPHLGHRTKTRVMIRMMTLIARRYVLKVEGKIQAIAPENDPFIAVLNHNQRYEAVLIPALLFFYRHGKPVHFMADWNFLLMPFVASLYRASQTIIVTNKDARPKWLNFLKPVVFRDKRPAFDRAMERLNEGSTVGIFPEGTVNRDPNRLMRGLPGAAKLSLLSGAPVLPLGIRFPEHDPSRPIPDGAKMVLQVGDPISAPVYAGAGSPSVSLVHGFHAQIMEALTALSGKSWDPTANKRRRYVV